MSVQESTRAETPPAVARPYVGLTFYTEADADRFFGRAEESAVVIGNLRSSRLTLLYAESGVGKSSLLRAGVAARLRKQAQRDAEVRGSPRFVPVVFSSWRGDPVGDLIDAIAEAIRPFVAEGEEIELPRGQLDDAIGAAAGAVGAKLLLILDQFEECFLYSAKEAVADQLTECVYRSDLRANFLISIREDAYAGIGDLFRGRIANVYGNFLHVEYLGRDGARDAIVKPIERLNESLPEDERYHVEPKLVEEILDQVTRSRGGAEAVGNGRGAADGGPPAADEAQIETTQLQLVLDRLWDEETEHGSRVLHLQTFQGLSGAEGITNEHLNRSMEQLPPEEQGTAASIFSFLVTSAGTKFALRANEVAELSKLPEPQVSEELERLADLRILRRVPLRDSRAYEIAHDALARPIVHWRDEKNAARLRQAEEREAHERKRKQIAVAGLAVFVVAFLATAIAFAVVQSNSADRQTNVAQSNEIAARLADFSGTLGLGPGAPALAGLEAFRLSPTFDARRQVLTFLQRNVGMPKILTGHTRDVLSVAFSPSAPLLASGSSDGSVRLWNRNGRPVGEPLRTADDGQTVTSLAFSPNGRVLVTARGSGKLDVWDVSLPARVRPPRELSASRRAERAVAFSPDGKTFASAGEDGEIRVWRANRAASVASVADPGSQTIYGLAFSPGGRFLAAASGGGLRLWRVGHGRSSSLRFVRTFGSSAAHSAAWADRQHVAAGTSSKVLLWDLAHPYQPRPFETADAVYAVAFTKNGTTLVAGGADSNVTAWNVKSGRSYGPPRTHTGYVYGVAVSPDGRTIASASADDQVKLWPMDGAGALASMVLGIKGEEDLAVADDGRFAAAHYEKGPILVGSLGGSGGSENVGRLTQVTGTAPIAYHGTTLAGTNSHKFTLWNTGSSCKTMPAAACRIATPANPEADVIYALAFSPSGKLLATGTTGGVLALWDVSNPENIGRLGQARQPTAIHKLAFSPGDENVLATGAQDGSVRLWDIAKLSNGQAGEQIGPSLLGHGALAVNSLAFSPDGSWIASGGSDQRVVVWDVKDARRPKKVALRFSQSNTILSFDFSPDGSTLAAGDGDGRGCLWDLKTLRHIGDCLFNSPLSPNLSLAAMDAVRFSRSGTTLLSAGRKEPVIAWNSILWSQSRDSRTLHKLNDYVCRLAGRNLTAEEWEEVFVRTKLEHHRHKTCPQYSLP